MCCLTCHPWDKIHFLTPYLVIMTIPLLHMIQSIIAFVPSVIRLAHTDRDVKAKRA